MPVRQKSSNCLLPLLSKVYWMDFSLVVNEKVVVIWRKEKCLNEFFGHRLLTACFLPYFGNSLLFSPQN